VETSLTYRKGILEKDCLENTMEEVMNWNIVEGKWNEMKGKLREKWGKLTDSDWEEVAGKKDRLVGCLQQRYGYDKDRAEREVDQRISSIGTDSIR
jgi:uncharacterized protein YjbJ (UPF0337 family)